MVEAKYVAQKDVQPILVHFNCHKSSGGKNFEFLKYQFMVEITCPIKLSLIGQIAVLKFILQK